MANKQIRINERIRVPTVRVIGVDGEQVGVLPVKEALSLAQGKSLDLVEVSPTAKPPVCRIMDFGKFMYEQNKRARKAKKKQHIMKLKEVKFRPKIDEHDYEFKVVHARKFLLARDKVRFTITFRGREMAHSETGFKLLQRITGDLTEVGLLDGTARFEGRNLVQIMVPKPQITVPKPQKTTAEEKLVERGSDAQDQDK
ncbi:MAG: translation initiation factor IF-3 [Candidatus Eisenbacteria bacterium]|nr:translation initiation factor IF-3 [Candidatus Eisenbacteria bacterium]